MTIECEMVHPVLRVSNVQDAIEFYTARLGFKLGFKVGEPPQYAGICIGHVQIFLEKRSPAGGGGAYLVVDDVEALFEIHRSSGVTADAEPADRDYGLRDYALRDPDGNLLTFGQRIYNDGPPIPIERVEVPLRLEKRLAALLTDLAKRKHLSLESCVEEILLHTNDGVTPHTPAQVRHIQELKRRYGIDYGTHASYRFVERADEPAARPPRDPE